MYSTETKRILTELLCDRQFKSDEKCQSNEKKIINELIKFNLSFAIFERVFVTCKLFDLSKIKTERKREKITTNRINIRTNRKHTCIFPLLLLFCVCLYPGSFLLFYTFIRHSLLGKFFHSVLMSICYQVISCAKQLTIKWVTHFVFVAPFDFYSHRILPHRNA